MSAWPKTAAELKSDGYVSDGSWTECRSCQARILWAETPNGKKMPMEEAQPDADGARRFQSHFQTCPNAQQHRRRR